MEYNKEGIMKEAKEVKIMDGLARNPKIVFKIQKLLNKMDGRCRQMAISKPSRPMADYCKKCQEKAKKILGDEIEL